MHRIAQMKVLGVVLVLALCSPMLAGSLEVQGGRLLMRLDDSGGGATGGWRELSVRDSTVMPEGENLLNNGAYFSILEPGFPFVNDGYRLPSDWATDTDGAIRSLGEVFGYAVTQATYTDPAFDSQRVIQLSYANPDAATDHIIVAFEVTNTWSNDFSSATSMLVPALWLMTDLGAEGGDTGVYDATRRLAYQFDATTGGYIGFCLLTDDVATLTFEDSPLADNVGPLSDLEEINTLTTGIVASTRSASAGEDIRIGIAAEARALLRNASFMFAAALCYGDTLGELQAAADEARANWNGSLATLGAIQEPSFTSTPTSSFVSVRAGDFYTYTIQAVGSPAPDVEVSGNPLWLVFDGVTLSGTPGEADVGARSVIQITASNGIGDDVEQQWTLVVRSALPRGEFGGGAGCALMVTGNHCFCFAVAAVAMCLALFRRRGCTR